MSEAVLKGIALEFGKQPNLRAFTKASEAATVRSSAPTLLIITPYSTRPSRVSPSTLLQRACEALRDEFFGQHQIPNWIARVYDSTEIKDLYAEIFAQAEPHRATKPRVVFYGPKSSEHWSAGQKTEFLVEIDAAMDLLKQLAPPDPPAQNPPSDSDANRRLQLARERRERLLAHEKWLNAPAVHIQQGGDPDAQGINNTASRLRRRGELLGAWNGREFLHPEFQFQPDTGRLMPEVKALLSILPKDRSGWRQIFWLYQRHAQLDGARPADVFPKDPHAVIKAARSDFVIDDERW